MSENIVPELTPFSVRCQILGELWLSHRASEEYADFIEYNDLGLPLAYAIAENIVTSTDVAEAVISETWAMLLEGLEVEDQGFENLKNLLG
jgi:hypothetical protein